MVVQNEEFKAEDEKVATEKKIKNEFQTWFYDNKDADSDEQDAKKRELEAKYNSTDDSDEDLQGNGYKRQRQDDLK